MATYSQLLDRFPPRIIDSQEKLKATQVQINSLVDAPTLTDDEREYLALLGLLVADYEDKEDIVGEVSPVEIVSTLLNERALFMEDLLPVFGSQEAVAMFMRGKRSLSLDEVYTLSNFFKISPVAFLDTKKIGSDRT